MYTHKKHFMRKIEREMNDAIRNRVDWSKDNTRVSISDAGNAHVLLHNNLIATVKKTRCYYLMAVGKLSQPSLD